VSRIDQWQVRRRTRRHFVVRTRLDDELHGAIGRILHEGDRVREPESLPAQASAARADP
jgi:hypothetical protein